MEKFDFSGWATKANLRCSDGRTIMKDAFKGNDGQTVPLVWNHQHNVPDNVLGHALLKNRDEGVYAYCTFNDTPSGQNAKLLVDHGDVCALSIYANQLKQNGGNVVHGIIREVSLVLAGANPGAFIDSIISHGDNNDENEEAVIYTGEEIAINHAEGGSENMAEEKAPEVKEASEKEETIQDVFNTLTEKQKKVVYAMIGMALESKEDAKVEHNDEGDENMKHNVFENENETKDNVISHSDMEAVISDAKRFGSMKESALQHGIENIDYLFPEDQVVGNVPEWVKRDNGWVDRVMKGVHHTPFSRIKSRYADITADDARAKGYIKGNIKAEEFFSVAKRSTAPTTIYKKQKLDRDDVIDITDFDVVAWIKGEMRFMLDEEIARAILVSDGRSDSSDDKINEQNIRPIWTDSDVFSVKKVMEVANAATDNDKAKAFIKMVVKAHKDYKGSGNPVLFTTEDVLTDCLLMEDTTGRIIYDTKDKLATALRVKDIVTVPVMENLTRTVSGATHTLLGIMVNLADYNVGADKGGAVSMFDDFDIDYNAQKYLIETRCSGALVKPYSAVVFESKPAN
jgi:hypothetical protein